MNDEKLVTDTPPERVDAARALVSRTRDDLRAYTSVAHWQRARLAELCDALEASLGREGQARDAPKDRAEALDRARALVPAMAALEDAERHAANIADALAQARAEGRREVLEALDSAASLMLRIGPNMYREMGGPIAVLDHELRAALEELRERFATPAPRGDGGAQ